MNRLPIIGILGHARVGKDTAARHMVSRLYLSYSIAFADKFKHMLSELYGIPLEYFYDDDLKDNPLPNLPGKTPRILMQETGEHFRQRDPQVWINYTLKRARKLLSDQPRDILISDLMFNASKHSIIISDIRYNSEVLAIRDAGGEVIKISKPGQDGQQQGLKAHISERDQDTVPEHLLAAHIVNDGNLEDLYSKLDIYLLDICHLDPGCA